VRTKHLDLALMHCGSPKGAKRIAPCWADNRKVPQVVFKPDWITATIQRRPAIRYRPLGPMPQPDRWI
jgi:hypothetical protein